MRMSSLPCGRPACIGSACGNFNDPGAKFGDPNAPRGCKGGKYSPWSWVKWYLNELPKYHSAKYTNKVGGVK